MQDYRDAFADFYSTHAYKILAFALRRVSADQAEDVVAETFLVAWRRWDDIPTESLAWLYGVARNVASNINRKSNRGSSLQAAMVQEMRDQVVPDLSGTTVTRLEMIEALNSLSHWDRQALCITAWEGLTNREAALALNCSPAAFPMRLYRARQRLAARLASLESNQKPFSIHRVEETKC